MCTYFCGNDHFNCVVNAKNETLDYQSGVPVEIESICNAVLRWDVMFFRKSVSDFTWYIRGLGVKETEVVFAADMCISQISVSKNLTIGLNDKDLYGVNFSFDYTKKILTWKIEKICISNPSVKIIQIASNDTTIFGVDERGGIYEIDSEIHLKWRLDGVIVKKLFCSYEHFIALSDTGALYTWGTGSRGQLGLRDYLLKCDIPTRIEFFDDLPSIITQISCGGWHTLALTSDGDVYSWGWNESFQLGHSSEKISNYSSDPYPIDLGSRDDPIVSIAAGCRHSVCLLKSGKVYTFGLNKQNQLGTGSEDTENRKEPQEIKFKFKHKPISVSCGRYSTFVYT